MDVTATSDFHLAKARRIHHQFVLCLAQQRVEQRFQRPVLSLKRDNKSLAKVIPTVVAVTTVTTVDAKVAVVGNNVDVANKEEVLAKVAANNPEDFQETLLSMMRLGPV